MEEKKDLTNEIIPYLTPASEHITSISDRFSWKESLLGFKPERFFYGGKNKSEVAKLFSENLVSSMGYEKEKADSIANEWSNLSGEEAYQKFSEVSPVWANVLREDLFPTPLEEPSIREQFEDIKKSYKEKSDAGNVGLWDKFAAWFTNTNEEYLKYKAVSLVGTETLSGPVGKGFLGLFNDVLKKVLPKEDYRRVHDNMKVDIHVDSQSWKPYHPIAMGILAGTGLTDDLITFSGGGVLNMGGSDKILYGLGYLAAMLPQLYGWSKMTNNATRQFDDDIIRFLERSIFKESVLSPQATNLAIAGRRATRTLLGGIHGGFNFSTLKLVHKGLNNFLTGEKFSEDDAYDVLQAGMMGFGMNAIGTWWGGVNAPAWLTKVGEETTQAALAATMQAYDVIQQKGSLESDDFWQMFAYELWESIPENMIPIVFGMSSFSNQFSKAQHFQTAEEVTIRTKAKIIQQLNPNLTSKAAVNDAVDSINKARDAFELKNNRRPSPAEFYKMLNGIKKGEIKDEIDIMMESGGTSKFNKAIAGDVFFRKLFKDYSRRWGLVDNPTPERIRELAKDPKLDYFKVENMAMEDEAEIYRHYSTRIMTAKDHAGEYVTDDDLLALYEKIGVGREGEGWDLPVRLNKDISLDVELSQEDYIKSKDDNLIRIKDGKVSIDKNKAFKLNMEIKPSEAEAVIAKDPIEIVEQFLRNYIEANYGVEFDPKYLTKYEYNHLMAKMERWEKVGGDEYTKYQINSYIKDKSEIPLLAQSGSMRDFVQGIPQFFEKYNNFKGYNNIRIGELNYNKDVDNVLRDVTSILRRNCGAKAFGGNWILKENAFKAVNYYAGTSEKQFTFDNLINKLMDAGFNVGSPEMRNRIKKAIGEYKAYLTSDVNSKYWNPKDWNIGTGLFTHFGIPAGTKIADFFPMMKYVNKPGDWDEIVKNVNNIHKKKRGGFYGEMPSYEDWDAEWDLGWKGLTQYTKRGLRTKHLDKPIRDLNKWVETHKELPSSARAIMGRWSKTMTGRPADIDKTMQNSVSNFLNKIPLVQVQNEDVPRLVNAALSFVHAGGLGLPKIASAIKNAFQGPLNNPPGMSTAWWVKGLYKTMTDPTVRHTAILNGIVDIYAVPGLEKDFNGGLEKLSEGLQKTLFAFTWVDHWWNRVPIYTGAQMQYDYYVNKFGIVDGTQKIMSKQHPETAKYFIEKATEAYMADKYSRSVSNPQDFRAYNSEEAVKIMDDLKDQYGFLQQANSNWEYGKLGRPHLFSFMPSRLGLTFMTWSTWYYGTYLPSLWQQDKMGLMQHWAKQVLVMTVMSKMFGMNMKPWMFTGPLPTQPYGPIPQILFNSIRVIKAWEYNNEEMHKEALDDLKRSAKVFVPFLYGTQDWVKVIEELKRECPYTDNHTGEVHYKPNKRHVFADLVGVSNYWNEMEKARRLLKMNERREAQRIASKYGVKFMAVSKGGGMGKLGGIPVIGDIR